MVCLATEDCYFILKVDTAAIQTAIDSKQGLGDDGLEAAFDVSNLTRCMTCKLTLLLPLFVFLVALLP